MELSVASQPDFGFSLLISMEEFARKQAAQKFMQRFVNRQHVEARLLAFHQELATISQDVSLSLDIDLRNWREEDREDRAADLAELEITLQHLIDNDYKILNALELKQQEYLEAMEALQKNLAEHVDRSLERNLERLFMEKALAQLRRVSQNVPAPAVHDWVITSWEVDIGETIAKGGFGEVAKGVWLGHTQVAVKRLFVRLDTNRLKDDFMREVKAWYPLRHPHVLPLLGACATAERPFMVSPFMHNGHALQYLDKYPSDSVRMMKLLIFLTIAGQVDENGRAYVSDFGFSYLKKITSTRQTQSGGAQVTGTLRWMAPERLLGGSPTAAVDVYAFAMTCYEVVTEGDIPLSNIPDSLVYQAVVNNSSRPQRPDECSNVMWDLITQCWHPDPLHRPSFASISVMTKSILAEVISGSEKSDAVIAEAVAIDEPVEDNAPPPPVEKDVEYIPRQGVRNIPEDNSTRPRRAQPAQPAYGVSDPTGAIAAANAASEAASNAAAIAAATAGGRPVNIFDSGIGSMASSAVNRNNDTRGRSSYEGSESRHSSSSSTNGDSFKLKFESGSHAEFVSKLADGLPLSIQQELHRKMAEFGKALNDGVIVFEGNNDLQSFAKDLQKAARESAIVNDKGKGKAPASVQSDRSSRSLRDDSDGDTTSDSESSDSHDEDDDNIDGGSTKAGSMDSASQSLKELKQQEKENKRMLKMTQKKQKVQKRVQKLQQKLQRLDSSSSISSSDSKKPASSGGGMLNTMASMLGTFFSSSSSSTPPNAAADVTVSSPATDPTFVWRSQSAQARSQGPQQGPPSGHRGGFGGGHRGFHRGGRGGSSTRLHPGSPLIRRIPNEDAREFWNHYWGDSTFEVTVSDFLSCLEEHCRGAVNRGGVVRILDPVDGPRGEKMVNTARLNTLVGQSATLKDAVEKVNNDIKFPLGPPPALPPPVQPSPAGPAAVAPPQPLPPVVPYIPEEWASSRSSNFIPPPVYITQEIPPPGFTSQILPNPMNQVPPPPPPGAPRPGVVPIGVARRPVAGMVPVSIVRLPEPPVIPDMPPVPLDWDPESGTTPVLPPPPPGPPPSGLP
ncbi:hypothetical protein HDU97_005859 [Phlyctochytrium planicorne]|nr:hypothetical protein HDU97_005859 [Phlyctochytrium planicorne]